MSLAISKLQKAEVKFTGYQPKADYVIYKILATTYCKLHFTQSLKDD